MGSKKGRHPEKALSAAKVRTACEGFYCDGNGLYLRVDASGARRWVLRTIIKGKRTDIGLGGLTLVSLAEARQEATRLRRIARIEHGDPLAERRQERRIVPSFEEIARQVHVDHSKNFRNQKHAAQWISTMEAYAFPVFGSRPVDQIESADILAALSPIWTEKPETARRVKQRIRLVLDTATARNFRAGNNPVEGISKVLPRHSTKQQHHPALPYAQVPEFITAMRECAAGVSAKLAFEFLILTAARTSEVLLAKWEEIDIDGKVWVVPASRMKAKEQHQVPLSGRCIEILKTSKEISNGGDYVFPGQAPEKPLSNMIFEMVLRRMNRTDITPHGFRSSFRDWCEEKTHYPNSVVEAALAHTIKDKVQAAYLRTKLFDKRIPLMAAWSAFATARPTAKVVKIREA